MYIVYILYFLLSGALSIFSYVLVDPNLTLFNHPIWVGFREFMVHLGYYDRSTSTGIFLTILILAFVFQKKITSLKKPPRPFVVALAIGIPLIISYPFLSRDFFNYMFDAKILTLYHQNPYLHKALDFPADHWLRFMHWTQRPYPYGPTFLPLTLIPAFLAFGKLLLSMLFFKATWILFYLATVFFTEKKHEKFALFFATSPLVIIEGLINGHNDLIAISLTILGMIALYKREKIKGYLLLVLSTGIKYFTAPFLLIQPKNRKINYFVLWSLIIAMAYLGIFQEFQAWYLLNFIPFLLVFEKIENSITTASFFALLAYYPYLALGDWRDPQVIAIKHGILFTGVIFTLLVFIIQKSHLGKSTSIK